MQELTRKEYYGTDKDNKPTHCVELHQDNIRVLSFCPSAYHNDEEKVLELVRQIPGEIFKDKKYEQIEERLEREKSLQRILKDENDKHDI